MVTQGHLKVSRVSGKPRMPNQLEQQYFKHYHVCTYCHRFGRGEVFTFLEHNITIVRTIVITEFNIV